MATIKKIKTLTKRAYLLNLAAKQGSNLTLLLNGAHGRGKTQSVKAAAEALHGFAFTIDGSTLKEGDLCGMPFVHVDADQNKSVRFIQHYVFANIARLEKEYYKKASTEGLLNGSIKVEVRDDGAEYLMVNCQNKGRSAEDLKKTGEEPYKEILVRDALQIVSDGEDNRYKFGEDLDFETKLKLITSGEIKPVILFFDELNRCDQQTMKEMMNVVLNRTINGYSIPWWVNIVAAQNPSSQNSVYAANELDPAEYSRFCNIRVDADLTEWLNYAAKKNLNENLVEALSVCGDEIFDQNDSSTNDTTKMTPDPRSWEMVSMILNVLPEANIPEFFDQEERAEVETDIRMLIAGKVGDDAMRTIMEAIKNAADNVKPADIFTGKAPKIDDHILDKYKHLKPLTQYVIMNNCLAFLDKELPKMKEASKGKEKEEAWFENMKGQINQFLASLNKANLLSFVKTLVSDYKNSFTYFASLSYEVLLPILQELQLALGTDMDSGR